MSDKEILAEVEGTFGEGTASSRLKQLEAALAPMYVALPKNEQGYLGHATVRYALHRLFVQRHGWFIKGLHAAGGHRNSTSSAGLLKEHVPAYIQDLFEQRLGGRGFGLHELGVLAATIEHLVHAEAVERLGDAFKVHSLLNTSTMSEADADEVLDTYMTTYILGEDLSNLTLEDVQELKAEMPETYDHWTQTQEFVRTVRRNTTLAESSLEQKEAGGLDFSLVARVAERVGEQFGSFQDQECKTIKDRLLEIEEKGTGRVRLSDFHKPSEDGHWQFQESLPYLRQIGALDEADPEKPRVIIANYVSGPSNCIASSSFYSVCCIDECEGLLGHIEQEVGAPEAAPAHIAELVGKLSSSTQDPQTLSATLLARLNEIATEHAGSVALHGRLFAQWMHHAFPRECPYPHLSGTTNPLTPDEYEQETGEESIASEEERESNCKAEDAPTSEGNMNVASEEIDMSSLPWSAEEELLVVRPNTPSAKLSVMPYAFLVAASLIAYAFTSTSPGTSSFAMCAGCFPSSPVAAGLEKFSV